MSSQQTISKAGSVKLTGHIEFGKATGTPVEELLGALKVSSQTGDNIVKIGYIPVGRIPDRVVVSNYLQEGFAQMGNKQAVEMDKYGNLINDPRVKTRADWEKWHITKAGGLVSDRHYTAEKRVPLNAAEKLEMREKREELRAKEKELKEKRKIKIKEDIKNAKADKKLLKF